MFRGPVEGKQQAPSCTVVARSRALLAQRWTSNNWPHIGCTRHTHTHMCVRHKPVVRARAWQQPTCFSGGELPQGWDTGTFGHLGHWDKPTSNREMEDLAFHCLLIGALIDAYSRFHKMTQHQIDLLNIRRKLGNVQVETKQCPDRLEQ